MNTSPDTDKLFPALLVASQAFEPVRKTKDAHRYKYADLAALMDVVRQPLADAGLFVAHLTTEPAGYHDGAAYGVSTTTRLIHAESGQWMESSLPIDADAADQAVGSSLTYRRRYCLLGLLSLAPEDDDGQAATDARKSRQQRQTTANLKTMASKTNHDLETQALHRLAKEHARPMGVEKPKDADPANVAPQKPNPKAFWDSVRKIMDGGGVITDHKKQEVIVRGLVEDAGHASTKDLSQAEVNTLLAKLADTYGAGATQDDPPF